MPIIRLVGCVDERYVYIYETTTLDDPIGSDCDTELYFDEHFEFGCEGVGVG